MAINESSSNSDIFSVESIFGFLDKSANLYSTVTSPSAFEQQQEAQKFELQKLNQENLLNQVEVEQNTGAVPLAAGATPASDGLSVSTDIVVRIALVAAGAYVLTNMFK